MADVKMAILTTAATVALGLGAGGAQANPYVAGDMHNHNTCTDGSVSVGYSVDRAVGTGTYPTGGSNFGLDWFTIGNHGGSGNRDCRFSDPAYDPTNSLGSAENGTATNPDGSARATLWTDTFGQTIQGTTVNSLLGTPNGNNMWRWQNIEQVEYPILAQRLPEYNKTLIEGLEWVTPGHEHTDVSIITGQFPKSGTGANADAVAQFEYRYDRSDNDLVGQLSPSGVQLWPGKDSVDNNGTAGHSKAVAGVAWLQANYPVTSYAVPTHTERQGPFDPVNSKGWNIEHFRDFNNAGPTVAFGIESPGHMAQGNTTGGAGSYGSSAVGGGTYGFQGVYTSKIGGLWDGLLGEGRNMFIYVSSDWHNRGIFAATAPNTTSDFQPGEMTKLYVAKKSDGTTVNGTTAQDIIDDMRSGNSYSVNGDLIGPDLQISAVDNGKTAIMGQTLVVNPGDTITYTVKLTLPAHNNSPYSFNNPLLAQLGINQPLNHPKLDHIDLITGTVTGPVGPGTPGYAVANAGGTAGAAIVYNASAVLAQQIPLSLARGVRTLPDGTTQVLFQTTFTAGSTPFYIRARGTNLPVATPNATDSTGAPLLDVTNTNVVCADPACPAHLAVNGNGQKVVSYDVQAYSNLWFYANPIFVRPASYPALLVEQNALLAQRLKSGKAQAIASK